MENINFNRESDISTEIIEKNLTRSDVSQAVIKRLPRYFRYLRELIRQGRGRISSGELAEIMKVTASQIRQDLNCFGGFGQQGYGYNVHYLYSKICELLGVGCGFRAVIVGAGNLGSALVRSTMFEKRGVKVIALFDVDQTIIGTTIGRARVYDMKYFVPYCRENQPNIAVLTLPKEAAESVFELMEPAGIHAIWNYSGRELDTTGTDIVLENVHLGDSLMTLCYELCRRECEEDPLLDELEQDGEDADEGGVESDSVDENEVDSANADESNSADAE